MSVVPEDPLPLSLPTSEIKHGESLSSIYPLELVPVNDQLEGSTHPSKEVGGKSVKVLVSVKATQSP